MENKNNVKELMNEEYWNEFIVGPGGVLMTRKEAYEYDYD